jgi:hypothetical protein
LKGITRVVCHACDFVITARSDKAAGESLWDHWTTKHTRPERAVTLTVEAHE